MNLNFEAHQVNQTFLLDVLIIGISNYLSRYLSQGQITKMSNILELALSQLAVHSITAAIPQQKLVKTFPHSTNI